MDLIEKLVLKINIKNFRKKANEIKNLKARIKNKYLKKNLSLTIYFIMTRVSSLY